MYAAISIVVYVFRKPSGVSGKGLYELKQECYSEYSPYYYHYTRTDQAKVIFSKLCLSTSTEDVICVSVGLSVCESVCRTTNKGLY